MFSSRSERQHYTTTAAAWTESQATRLGVTPEAITATITRGWLPDEIDRRRFKAISRVLNLQKPPG